MIHHERREPPTTASTAGRDQHAPSLPIAAAPAGALLRLQQGAGNRAVTSLVGLSPRVAVQRDPVPVIAPVDDPAEAQLEAVERALGPAIERVLVDASRQAGFDFEAAMVAAVAESLAAAAPDARGQGEATAREIALLQEQVDVPPHGGVPYDLALVLLELDALHRHATGLDGVTVSAGVRQVIRTGGRHATQAIAAAMPGTPSFAPLYVHAVGRDIADAAAAVHDATALLRLELEGTITELLDLRRTFALAADQGARAATGAAIGDTSRRALLLNDALANAAGAAGVGPTALDTAVEARAADIARIRQTANTEQATRQALGNAPTLLAEQPVTIGHGATDDAPVDPIGEHAETVVLPEEALPEATDAAERTMAGELSTRVAAQREEVRRLRAQVVPAQPAYTLEEFAAVHRRWFGLYSTAQEQQDPTVRMVLDLMGEPYRMMGADYGSAALSVEGGVARAYLMNVGVELMSGALHGETTQFGARVDAGGPTRRTTMGGTADAPEYRYGEMLPGQRPYEPGRAGEVQSRQDFRGGQQQATAAAATAVSAVPAALQPATARHTGLSGGPDVPLVGVRAVGAQEGWTYLTDVRTGPDDTLVAREQKVVAPEVAEYLLAARQQAGALGAAHVPTADGRPIGSSATRAGGVEAAPGTSADRYVAGETSPRVPSEVASLQAQLQAAQRETGIHPGGDAPDAERLTGQLIRDLRAYLDGFFAERQSIEYRLAAIFALANTEHAIGAQITNLLRPETLATMVAEAVKISAVMATLQALGPLGALAARAYQAHLSAQGVSNVAALIAIAGFCRNAAGADSLSRARAWGYMSRNIVADAGELFENLVTSPVTAGMHALTAARPSSPRGLADALSPLLQDPTARASLMRETDAEIARLEAANPNATVPELQSLRAFRDSLLGRSALDTAAAAEADLPGARAEPDPATALFTGPRQRSDADRAALRAAAADVPFVESTTLTGNEVRVRYGDDGSVRLEIGPLAEPAHLRRHQETVRQLRRYEGVLGRLRRLLSRVRQALTGHPEYGTRGFEARLEVQKLNAIITHLTAQLAGVEARGDRLTTREGADPAREADSIRSEIAALERQLARHEADVDSYESGRGFVAAEDTTAAMEGARARARGLRERAEAAAPGIRSALERAVAEQGASLAGLEFEVKSEDSLARKIHDRAAQRGRPATDARLDAEAAKINDVLRYTVVADGGTYMAANASVRAALEAAGYTFVKQGNAWAEPERFGGLYRGINTTFRTRDGLDFEVQFHTRESLAMKQELHILYEEYRDPATPPARRAELEADLRRRAGMVPVPPDAAARPAGGGGRR